MLRYMYVLDVPTTQTSTDEHGRSYPIRAKEVEGCGTAATALESFSPPRRWVNR